MEHFKDRGNPYQYLVNRKERRSTNRSVRGPINAQKGALVLATGYQPQYEYLISIEEALRPPATGNGVAVLKRTLPLKNVRGRVQF